MDSAARQAKLGQAGYIAVAFATPFAVMCGTGSYANAQPVESTGNSLFVEQSPYPAVEEIEIARFVRDLDRLINEYKLSKNQAAKFLGVTRQTIYSWLDKKTDKVRALHKTRLSNVLNSLDKRIGERYRVLVGGFLNRKLDSTVAELFSLISENEFPKDKFNVALRALEFKLSGIERSSSLSDSLKNKKPLI
ncbi:hypothetical protein ACJJID_02425 [Microbulbifer sp. CnH-101-G]|uniref:hypothetical protein n=1 Tax=Microbulbifer sp. CnH-101-G TaxID=3243393 RepID=UPI00403A1D1B